MSFDVHFFARDYMIDEPRLRTPDEAAALQRVASDHGVEEDSDVSIDSEEASAGLSIRNLQPQHCSFIHAVCDATDWVAVLANNPEQHVALATSAFEPPAETVFAQVFGIDAVQVVRSAGEVSVAITEAFKSWNEWAGFDAGQREENV